MRQQSQNGPFSCEQDGFAKTVGQPQRYLWHLETLVLKPEGGVCLLACLHGEGQTTACSIG